jgi:2-dehydro-3-deoxygluconokinase
MKTLASHAEVLFADSRDLALMLELSSAQLSSSGKSLHEAAFEAFPRLQWIAALQRQSEQVDSQELSGVLYAKQIAEQTVYRARAYRMSAIVDRIGAGDAFAAGILHARIRNMDAQNSLDFGVAAACLKHSIPGDFNLVTEDDVQHLLSGATIDVRR